MGVWGGEGGRSGAKVGEGGVGRGKGRGKRLRCGCVMGGG